MNVLAVPMGLFLWIGGANKHLISVLNSIGLSSLYWTVERLKGALMDDAIQHMQELFCSEGPSMTVFDNINVYLRKFEQHLTNWNSMLSLTNIAIIKLQDIQPGALALQPLLDMQGNWSKATPGI